MSSEYSGGESTRFETALRRFDEENSQDTNRQEMVGSSQPRELVYAQWLTEWVLRLEPEASEPLRLAARCQHLCRWQIPRSSYPMTRVGYLQWREGLKKFHAQKAGEILREAGYPEDLVAMVQGLVLKRNFPHDREGRVLEDALCLVFLEHQFEELAGKSGEEKMINVLQKTWKKMTPKAQQVALGLTYGPREKALLERALKAVLA
jgi:Domain of unknown function (DUF4202)